jgi:hypothetical protein
MPQASRRVKAAKDRLKARSGRSGVLLDAIHTPVYTEDMKAASQHRESRSERVIFTLPRPLVVELEEFADALRDGNKSGFVADAIQSYIDQFRRRRHTSLLRASYAAAAKKSQAIAREWEPLDDETWAKLDALERKTPRKRR